MRSTHMAVIAFAFAVPLPGAAQSEGVTSDSSGLASQDTTSPAPKKKKGGLFGKAKGLAKNKVVKTIAKTAACTMLPGGQIIASAIDGGAEGAAGGAVAGVATGQSGCMPGGLGAGGLTGAAASAAAAEAAAMAHAPPAPGMHMDPAAAGEIAGPPDEEKIAQCLGLTPEEFRAFTDPTGGQPRQPTKQEMKRHAELSKKLNMRRYQTCMMQQ